MAYELPDKLKHSDSCKPGAHEEQLFSWCESVVEQLKPRQLRLRSPSFNPI
jgi:hypothetical protein